MATLDTPNDGYYGPGQAGGSDLYFDNTTGGDGDNDADDGPQPTNYFDGGQPGNGGGYYNAPGAGVPQPAQVYYPEGTAGDGNGYYNSGGSVNYPKETSVNVGTAVTAADRLDKYELNRDGRAQPTDITTPSDDPFGEPRLGRQILG